MLSSAPDDLDRGGVGNNGERVVEGVRSYPCGHSLCGYEGRKLFKGEQRGRRGAN